MWRPASVALALAASTAPAAPQKVPDVRIDTGVAAGAGGSGVCRIAAAGSRVYACWQDSRHPRPTIYFNRSVDGGFSWPAQDIRIDLGKPPGSSSSRSPDLAASGSSVYVAFEDARELASHIYFTRSIDGGATWPASAIELDLAPVFVICRNPRVAACGAAVYVCWQDQRNGSNYDIYFTRSPDRGSTWLPQPVRLDTGSQPGAADSTDPQIACDGSAVHVTWFDWRNGIGDIYFNRSLDRGATWLESDVRLDVGLGRTMSRDPQIAASGSAVYVVWAEGGVTDNDIYVNRSLDAGRTWLGPVRLDVGSPARAAASRDPQIAASESEVHVCWGDGRNGRLDIYANRSVDRGATWLPQDVRLDVGDPPGANSSFNPQVAASGAAVHVTWSDERAGNFVDDIYFNRSTDAGATWLTPDVRLDVGDPPGASVSQVPQIAASGSSAYVVWQDYRNGPGHIYFNLALGYQAYGAGTAGSGSIVPTIGGSGEPSIGSTISVGLAAGLGAARGVVVMGTAPAATSFAGGTLLVLPPFVALPVQLAGPPGAPGQGSASLPLAIPAVAALLGSRVNFQGLLLDPAAPEGLSMTGGLETWIL